MQELKMTFREYKSAKNLTTFFLATVFVAQHSAIQFLPVYLKYLNFSAIEVGIIRASQTWMSILLIPAWLYLTKKYQSVSCKRFLTTMLLLITITVNLCLTFIPLSNVVRDVTHCNKYISFPLVELVRPHHDRQWDHYKSIPPMSVSSANLTNITRPTDKMHYTIEGTMANFNLSPALLASDLSASMTTKQESLPIVVYHDSAVQANDSLNVSSHSHSSIVPISATQKNISLSDSTTDISNNISSYALIGDMFPSTTDKELLTETVTVNYRNDITLAENEIKLTFTPQLKELNNSKMTDIREPALLNGEAGEADVEKKGMKNIKKVENNTATVIPKDKIEHSNTITELFSLLNRTASKSHIQQNKLLNENSNVQRTFSNKKQDNSDEVLPNFGTVTKHFNPETRQHQGLEPLSTRMSNVVDHVSDKEWNQLRSKLWSQLRDIYSKQRKQHINSGEEEDYIHSNSEINKSPESLLPQHTGSSSVQLKHQMKYQPQYNNFFRNIAQVVSEQPESYHNYKKPTDRLQPDVEWEVGNPRRFESEESNILSGKLFSNDSQHFHEMLTQHKDDREILETNKKEKFVLTPNEEAKYLSTVKRIKQIMKQMVENRSHPRRKRYLKSARHRSLKLEQPSKTVPEIHTQKFGSSYSIGHMHERNKKIRKHKRYLKLLPPALHTRTVNYKDRKEASTTQGTIRRLMFIDLLDTNHFNDDTDIQDNKVHMSPSNEHNISVQLWSIVTKRKLPESWSTTFSIIIILAVLVEVSSTALITMSSKFVQCADAVGTSVYRHMTIQNDYQQVCSLMSLGFIGCPLMTVLVLATNCSYQPRVFLLVSTGLFIMALLESFFLHELSSTCEWKLKDHLEKKQNHTSLLQRFGGYVSTIVIGFAMACNLEFILWHIDTLHGFPYNYQLLYCSYIAIGALAQAVITSWLQKRLLYLKLHQDHITTGDRDIAVTSVDGLWSVGPILLGIHFLAASLLQSAWVLVFLGILQGFCAALVTTAATSNWLTVGYGLGSLVGGFMVDARGTAWLFWIMAGSMFIWSAMVTLCGGLLKCVGSNDRGQASYSQLLLPEEDSENEEEEICVNEDWLEKALQKDEQNEAQRRRIMSCPT